jgi:hypothetical protein
MTNAQLDTLRTDLENSQAELASAKRRREAVTIEISPDELDRIRRARDPEQTMDNPEREGNRLLEARLALRRMAAA